MIIDQRRVTEIFNNFFVNVADGIGTCVTFDENNHPSICKIKENFEQTKPFTFTYIGESKVSKYMDKLNVKKATGADKISGNILKLAKPALLSPIAEFINLSIQTSTIPERTKLAQVTPLHKKNDPMDKTNFRPVSF